MSTGIINITHGRGVTVRLLENLAAAQGAPPDGAAPDVLKPQPSSTQFFNISTLYERLVTAGIDNFRWPDSTTLRLYETAGSGTITIAYARLWLYDAVSQRAYPAGIGADADKGKLNGAAVAGFGETGSDKLRHVEPFIFPGDCDGINVELGPFGGTSPTFNVDWFIPLWHLN